MRGAFDADGWPAPPDEVEAALGWLAELAPDGAELWLDGGHNPDGGRAVAAAMADLDDRSPAPVVLIAAMLSTKDADGYLANFKGLARELIAVPLASQMAGRPAAELAAIANRVGIRSTTVPGIEAMAGQPTSYNRRSCP